LVTAAVDGLFKIFHKDEYELERELGGDSGRQPPKDAIPDEQLTIKQVEDRYAGLGEAAVHTLALMDHDKIDYDLVESVLTFIVDGDHEFPREGSILVFLPGLQEIMSMHDQIASHPLLGAKAGRFKLVPLHSSLSSEEQAEVFARPKTGVRKIGKSTYLKILYCKVNINYYL